MPTLGRGRIILAFVADPRGQNPKERLLVVVTPTEEIQEGGPFACVAVTSNVSRPLPEEYVELPFHPGGHSRTGLRKLSAAVCNWLQELRKKDVIRNIGRVPDKNMLEILEKLRRFINLLS